MPVGRNQRANAQYRTTRKNVVTNWTKNALKSVGLSTKTALAEYAPNLTEPIEASASVATNIYKNLTQNKTSLNKVTSSLQNSKYAKYARQAFNTAINDLKTGDFNHPGGGFGFDDSDDSVYSFGTDDEDEGNVNIDMSPTTDAMLSVGNAITKQSITQIKTAQASMDAQISMNAAQMYQREELGSEIIGHLTNINNNLAAMVAFNNTNMSKFIETSIAYYEKIGSSMTDRSATINDNRRLTAADVIGKKGGIDVGNYKKYITQELKRYVKSSNLGMLGEMLTSDMFLEQLASNPLGAISNAAVSAIMPKVITNTLEGLDKAFSTYAPKFLSDLGNLRNSTATGLAGDIQRAIGNIFGLKVDNRINNLNAAKVERGPIPFDGETKHAITEIITKELREQTSYLKGIAEKINPKFDARANQKIFDYNQNRYIGVNDIDKNIGKELARSIAEAFDQTAFGNDLRKFAGSMVTSTGEADNKAIEEMNRAIEELYVLIQREGDDSNLNINNLIGRVGASRNTREALKNHIKDMRSNRRGAYESRTVGRIHARSNVNRTAENIRNNASTYHLYDSAFNNEDMIEETLYNYLDEIMGYGKYRDKDNAKATRRIKYNSNANISGAGTRDNYLGLTEFMDRISNALGLSITSDGEAIDTSSSTGAFKSFMRSSANRTKRMGKAIISGDAGEIFRTYIDKYVDMAKVFGGRLKVALFGSRDENGKHDGKGLFGDIRSAASEFFLGKDDGTGKKQGGIFNTISSGITSSFKSWLTVFFDKKEGENDSQYKDRIYGEFKQKFKNGLPKALDGALIGGALGAMSSGSLIGGILGGPMMGAVMGAAGGFLTQSETFMKWLFGEKVDPNDPSKGRMGGFISKRVQDFVKDHKEKLGLGAVGGAIVGGFAGASKFGILGGLVGGPVAGAILGVATSIAHSSGAFQRFMYGDESHQGIFKMVANGWKEGTKGRKLNMFGVAGAGMLTGTMMSKFGILGASLLPGGVIGGALAGLGSAILMNADVFKKELFGEDDKWVDAEGKSHSYRKGGFFKQLSNNITVNILNPVRTAILTQTNKLFLNIEHGILIPIKHLSKFFAKQLGNLVTRPFTLTANLARGAWGLLKETSVGRTGRFIGRGIGNLASGAVDLAGNALNNTLNIPRYLANFLIRDPNARQDYLDELSTTQGLLRANRDIKRDEKRHNANAKRLSKLSGGNISDDTEEGRDQLAYMLWKRDNQGKDPSEYGNDAYMEYRKKVDNMRGIKGSSRDYFNKHRNELTQSELVNLKNPDKLKGENKALFYHAKETLYLEKIYNHIINKDGENKKKIISDISSDYKYDDDLTPEENEEKEKEYKSKYAPYQDRYAELSNRGNILEADYQSELAQNAGKRRRGLFKRTRERFGEHLISAKYAKLKNKYRKDLNAFVDDIENDPSINGSGQGGRGFGSTIANGIRGAVKKTKKRFKDALAVEVMNPDEINAGKSDIVRTSAADDGTSSITIAEKHEAEEKADFKKWRDTILEKLDKNREATEEHSSAWDKIFSKKGLITGLIIAGAPILLALIKKIIDKLKDWGPLLNDVIGEGITHAKGEAEWTEEEGARTNGDTIQERIDDLPDTLNPFNLFTDTGEITNLTEGKTKLLLNLFGKPALAVGKGAIGLAKGIGKGVGLAGKGIGNLIGGARNFFGDASKAGSRIMKNAQKQLAAGKISIDDYNNIMQKTLAKYGDDAVAGTSRFGGMMSRLGTSLTNLPGNIGKGLRNFGSGIANIGDNLTFHMFSDAGKNGQAAINKAYSLVQSGAIGVDEYYDLVNKSVSKYGEAAMAGTSRFGNTAVGRGLSNLGDNIVSTASGLADNVATKASGLVDDAGRLVSSGVGKIANSQFANATREMVTNSKVIGGAKQVGGAVGKVASKGTQIAKNAAGGAKSLMSKCTGFIDDFIGGVVKKLGSALGKAGSSKVVSSLASIVSKFKSAIPKIFEKVAPKITAVLSATAAKAASVIGFLVSEPGMIALGALNGITGAAKLFHVDENSVDSTMTMISAAFGAFSGSTIGSILEILNGAAFDIIGVDIFCEIAAVIYNFIMKAGGDEEAIDRLRTAQEEFKSEYIDYQESTLESQLNAQKAAGIVDESVTLEQFKEGVKDGTYEADYKSFADYNTQEHKSAIDKVMAGAGKGINKIKNSKIVKSLFGEKKEQYYVGKDGKKYTRNSDDGLFYLTDEKGKQSGEGLSERALQSSDNFSVEETEGKKGIVQQAIGAIGSGASKLVSGAGTVLSSLTKGIAGVAKTGASMFSHMMKGEVSEIFKMDVAEGFQEEGKDGAEISPILRALLMPSKLMATIIAMPMKLINVIGSGIKKVASGVFSGITSAFKTAADSLDDVSKATDSNDMAKLSAINVKEVKDKDGATANLLVKGIVGIAKIFGGVKIIISKIVDKLKPATEMIGNAIDGVKDSWNKSVVGKIVNTFVFGEDKANEMAGDDTATATEEGGNGGRGGTNFNQKDSKWGSKAYGNDGSTMADSGCGPAVVADVVNDMGVGIKPTDVASRFVAGGYRDSTGTNWNGISPVLGSYGLASKQEIRPSAEYIYGEVASGKPVILSGKTGGYGNKSAYTSSGHYIYATGVDEAGNVIYNDPNGGTGKINVHQLASETGSAWSVGGRGDDPNSTDDTGTAVDVAYTTDTSSYTGESSGTSDQWLDVVAKCKEIVANKCGTYDQGKYENINVGEKTYKFRRDCSGFVSLCLQVFGTYSNGRISSSSDFGSTNSTLSKAGWSHKSFSSWQDLTPGDIVGIPGTHVQIFAGFDTAGKPIVYNYGSNRSAAVPGTTHPDMSKKWTSVWSPPEGATSANSVGSTEDSTVNGNSTVTGNSTSGEKKKLGVLDILGKIPSFIGEFASRALGGNLSNTNYDNIWYDEESTSSDSSSSDTSTSTSEDGYTADSSIKPIKNINEAYSTLEGLGLSGKKVNFFRKILPGVLQSKAEDNVRPSITMSQAALESGWGESGLSSKYNNLFGMKAGSSWTGPTADMQTKEADKNGNYYTTTAKWRVYPSWGDSVLDHGKLFTRNSRYKPILDATSWEEAAKALGNSGYATAPDYGSKIANTISANKLYSFDNFNPQFGTEASGGNGGRGNASITNRRYNTNPRSNGGRGQINSASAIYGNNVSRSGSTNYNVYNNAKDYNSKIDAIINYLAEIAGYSEATSNNVLSLQGSGGNVTNVAVQNPNGGFVNKTMVRDPMDIVKSTSKTGIPQLIAKGGIS